MDAAIYYNQAAYQIPFTTAIASYSVSPLTATALTSEIFVLKTLSGGLRGTWLYKALCSTRLAISLPVLLRTSLYYYRGLSYFFQLSTRLSLQLVIILLDTPLDDRAGLTYYLGSLTPTWLLYKAKPCTTSNESNSFKLLYASKLINPPLHKAPSYASVPEAFSSWIYSIKVAYFIEHGAVSENRYSH